jgi:hypothetical protein
MKSRIITFFLMAGAMMSSVNLFAQTGFALPANTEMNTAADYKRHEPTVIKAAKWLEQTPLDQFKEDRAKVNAYVINWSSGPSVNVNLSMKLMMMFKDNSNLLAIYLGSYCRYCLENNVKGGKEAAKAGFTSVNNVYTKGVAVKKNASLDNLSKQIADGKLDQFVATII